MKGHGAKFSRKKEQAVAALLAHRNLEEAARSAGISVATLKRWNQLPEFREAHLQARRDVVFQTGARLQQSASAAATVMLKVMADPATPAAVRARTAQSVVDFATRSLELEDLAIRIARLEENERRRSKEKADKKESWDEDDDFQ